MLRCITKTRGEASAYAKKALNELDSILAHCESFGNKTPVNLAPGLLYSWAHFRGVVFQVAMQTRKKKRIQMDVLAAGGRYDQLVCTSALHERIDFSKLRFCP